MHKPNSEKALVAARQRCLFSLLSFTVVNEGRRSVIFETCAIPEVIKIRPRRHSDDRGYFVELFRDDLLRAHAGEIAFVQHNQSLSRQPGTVRGLHYQVAPAAQGKLVRCLKGAILDVAVDIRPSSSTFGRHVAVELAADEDTQLWIPDGFAHGFCTLVPDTVVWYAVTHVYSPAHERGLFWNDPDLAIRWPVDAAQVTVSERDARQPRFRALSPQEP